ncbi:MAG: hypothetical protein NT032_02450 [Actinobacteria bacterium]|nr:hypothetical protein [Actinomycetota bacterium]
MRRITQIFLAFSLVFSLAACGYGSVPDTAKMGPAGSGTDAVIGEIKVQEVLVITDGTNAVLTGVIINSGTEVETLLSASVDNQLVDFVNTDSGVPTTLDSIEIAPGAAVSLSFTAPLGALLNNSVAALPTAGSIVKVKFSFANNGFVKVEALAFANEDIYSSVYPSIFSK